MKTYHHYEMLFLGIFLLFTLIFLGIPGLPLHWKLYTFVHGIVAHEHNVFLAGKPLPLCARNLGLYTSFLLTMFFLWFSNRRLAGKASPQTISLLLFSFFCAMTFDGFNSMFAQISWPHLYEPRNSLRIITGIGTGIAFAVAIFFMFNWALQKELDQEQFVLSDWQDLGKILLLNSLILVIVYGKITLLYWPLALISVLGITGMLFSAFLLPSSIFLGYSRSITNFRELARPATFALLLTLGLVVGTALLRF